MNAIAKNNIQRTERGYAFNGLEATGLAPQEARTLLLRAAGKSLAECAAFLGCSVNNINARTNNLFFKLRANSTPELIAQAFKSGALRTLALLAAINCAMVAPHFADNTSSDKAVRIARTLRVGTRNRRESELC